MHFQEIRQAASQGTISLPPPSNSEGLENELILKTCLKVVRELSDFRYSFATSRIPETSSRLMTIVEAKNQLMKRDHQVSLSDYFLSEIVPNPGVESLVLLDDYVKALTVGAKSAPFSPVSVKTIIQIANQFPADQITWRQNKDIGERLLAPDTFPDSKAVQFELVRWDNYCRTPNDLDPLVHSLLCNLYFMAIAPLSRHNERIGQILLQLSLMGRDLNSPAPCIQLGKALVTNAHFGIEERLYGLRTRQWSPYLQYMLRTLLKATSMSIELLRSIDRLYNQTEDYLKNIGLSSHIAFLPAIFMHPACRTGELSSYINTRRQVASHILNDLAHANILSRTEDGRDRVFYNKRLIELLESDNYSFTPLPTAITPFIPLYQKGTPGRQRKSLKEEPAEE